jgi:hypothetical protein
VPERAAKDKLTHAAVNFEHPSEHPGERCARCKHFIFDSPPKCQSVKGPIHWDDFCIKYEARA